jgi:hypothetical protein
VCTVAFGMGIDIPRHWNCGSLEVRRLTLLPTGRKWVGQEEPVNRHMQCSIPIDDHSWNP